MSCWVEAGFQLKQVSIFAGHSTVSLTLDRYSHLFPKPEDEAERFSEIEAGIIGI